MKKSILFYALSVFAFFTGTTGCSDFDDTNIDPEHITEETMDFRIVFSNVVAQACGSDYDVWRNGLIYCANMMQHTTSVDWQQGVFYTYSSGYNSAYWDALYSGDRGALRDVVLIMNEWEGDDSYANEYQMCRIIKAYIFHRMTDLYGDIPYSEASHAYDENILYPKYDEQKDIYLDLLNELDEAQAAIDPSLTAQMTSQDLMYSGDASKWKKFANSLMLRIAMRMTKVDPATAETWVKKAVSNGLFESVSDNAMVAHPDGSGLDDGSEPYGKVLAHEDPQAFYVSEYFVNLLKSTNDPRLRLIATVCDNPSEKWEGDFDYGECEDTTKLIGMPVGYDVAGGQWDLSNAAGYPGTNWRSYYALPNRYTFARPDVPTMIATYAEQQLLLAEAAYRGWVSGSAKDYYEQGVRAAMQQFSSYSNSDASALYSTYLSSSAVNQYLDENPFDESRALEMINTQYYITTFCDEYETFANWRRSGYPELTPVNKGYTNCVTNGTIPRRFTYPTTEEQVNSSNYLEAVSRISGGDQMTSRVWWDVE